MTASQPWPYGSWLIASGVSSIAGFTSDDRAADG